MPARIRSGAIVFVALASFFLTIFQATASEEPAPEDLILPIAFYPTNTFYATLESVAEEPGAPGFLIFTVSAPYGVYTAHGLTDLRKCLCEIQALEKIKHDKILGGGIAAGAADSLKDTAIGFKNFFLNPLRSISGIGKGIGKLGGKIGGAFRKKEKGETDDDSYLLSSTKRELARELGVDIYSRNPYLQKKLDMMAAARVGGKGLAGIVTFFIPVGTIASAVMTASSLNNAADELVNDNNRGDLYQLNQEALLGLGFTKENVTRFLNHPHYSPRELTYLRFYLEKLREAEGFEAILENALAANSEVTADKILHEAQVAADTVTDYTLDTIIILTPEGIVVEMQEKVLLATAYDYLDISALSERVAQRILSVKATLNKKSMEIKNGGYVTSRLDETFLLKGIRIEGMCLFRELTAETQAGELFPAQ